MSSIKGFNKLTKEEQELFERVYKRHQSALGTDEKAEYAPTSVKSENGYLKVTFKNRDWLHYRRSGNWD